MDIILEHNQNINLDQIIAVGEQRAKIKLADSSRKLLQERRKQIEDYIKSQDLPAYGFNRGFGHNVDLPVSSDNLSDLQEKLIVSHSAGLGDTAPKNIVRMTMLLRAQSLCRGYSGVRPDVIEQILNLINHDIIPVVPEYGSVGASGDLIPLSHIALSLMGKGKAHFKGRIVDSKAALKESGLSPLKLEMKEGLALNNGVQFMTAIGLYCCEQMKNYLKTACILTSMTTQVMLAPDTPFRKDLHELRPHPGAVKTAKWIYDCMKDSPIRESHRDYRIDGEIQNPYNIRCAAQILGSCSDLIDECEKALLLEANSVTDNPILLPVKKDNDELFIDIVSGGHFHGMPVAIRVFNLFQAMGIMAGLINQRCARYVDENQNKGLGRDMKWHDLSDELKAISSGMMLPEYCSAALTNAIWGEAMPSHLFNIPTNTGQEDHVSMGTGLAIRLLKALPKISHLLAIEMAYIIQAAAIRKQLQYIPSSIPVPEKIKKKFTALKKELHSELNPFIIDINIKEKYPIKPEQRKLNQLGEDVLEQMSQIFPPVIEDRILADQLQALSDAISQGQIVDIVSNHVSLA